MTRTGQRPTGHVSSNRDRSEFEMLRMTRRQAFSSIASTDAVRIAVDVACFNGLPVHSA